MKPHEERVEKSDLDEKISKLNVFIKSDVYSKLSRIDKNLLSGQCRIMETYSNILYMRIERFEKHVQVEDKQLKFSLMHW